MLGFQSDKTVDVRKFIISFLEQAWYVMIYPDYFFQSLVDPLPFQKNLSTVKSMGRFWLRSSET